MNVEKLWSTTGLEKALRNETLAQKMYCEKVSFIQEMTFMVKVILKMHKVLSLTLKGLPFIDSRNVY